MSNHQTRQNSRRVVITVALFPSSSYVRGSTPVYYDRLLAWAVEALPT